jgi:hypothetical protein
MGANFQEMEMLEVLRGEDTVLSDASNWTTVDVDG